VNTDDPEKLRGVKSDVLFIDEASEIDEESYFQLSIRCTGEIVLAFNPTISPYHWIRKMDDCQRFTTTYKDNPYLPEEMIKAIEDLKHKNEKYWKIYGLGEYAPNDKAIFTFQIIDEMPVCELVGLGMDFGFSNDETALVAVHRQGDMLYLRELMYETGLVTKDIVDRLNKLNVQKTEIWGDSSEPRLIEELYRSGFNIKPVKKGPDSINFGIGVLQNYGLCVERSSQNLINELYSYQWATDKYGIVLDKPEGGLDHLIDAMRYVAMSKLSIKQQNKGKYTLTFK
jgi:phage terminase large subunit